MDGRFFGGQKLSVTRYNGEHYNKSDNDKATTSHTVKGKDIGEADEEEEERLKAYIDQVHQE